MEKAAAAVLSSSAAKLLADLASDQAYLTASKVDDGTGHRVVTKKGKVLFLKASSGQEEAGLRSLMKGLLGRRDDQYRKIKKAFAALQEDAELRGLSLKDDGKRGKDGVKFDHVIREQAATILAENVKRQQDVAERQNRISTLFDRSKARQSTSPEAAIDEFLVANGSGLKKNGEEHFLVKLGAVATNHDAPIPPLDELALPSDQRNYQLALSLKSVMGPTFDVAAVMSLKETELNRSFHDATNSFVAEKMLPGDAKTFPAQREVFQEIAGLPHSYIIGKSVILIKNLFFRVNDLNVDNFKQAATEICVTFENQFSRLELAGRLLTNEQYLEQVPVKHRGLIRRYGEALQEFALTMLDGDGAYMKLFRMAQAAETSPEIAKAHLSKVLSAIGGKEPSATSQVDRRD